MPQEIPPSLVYGDAVVRGKRSAASAHTTPRWNCCSLHVYIACLDHDHFAFVFVNCLFGQLNTIVSFHCG